VARDLPIGQDHEACRAIGYSFGLLEVLGARSGSAGLGGCRNVRKRSKRWPSAGFLAAGAPARLSAVLSVDMNVTFLAGEKI
jgi:hypothetical protein